MAYEWEINIENQLENLYTRLENLEKIVNLITQDIKIGEPNQTLNNETTEKNINRNLPRHLLL